MSFIESKIPSFFYGTAWKEERTEGLTFEALKAGFTAIDTANQRKHYFEEGVGKGLQKFLQSSAKDRGELFLQTKFTYARGQDQRKPYDENASYSVQVRQSFESSLKHLGVEYLDSYLLHGPFSNEGCSPEDLEVWAAFEELQREGLVRVLGVSNVHLTQLEELYDRAVIKPLFVQNRCYARFGWDQEIREFCRLKNMRYQGFSLLTANRQELLQPSMRALAEKYHRTVAQIVFRFSLQVGMIPLTGTSSPEHMSQDLAILDFELTPEELKHVSSSL